MSVPAWRVWEVSNGGDLLSAYKTTVLWPRDEAIEAQCLAPGPQQYFTPVEPRHPAPQKDCLCGLYGWLDPNFIERERWAFNDLTGWRVEKVSRLVLGRVAVFGRVVPTTLGYRAERMRPRALVSGHPHVGTDAPVAEVAARYGLPLVDWEEALTWAA